MGLINHFPFGGLKQKQFIFNFKIKKMKTYIVLTSNGYVATLAGNKTEAYNKVKSAFPNRKVNKGNVNISSVHIDYVTFDKIA